MESTHDHKIAHAIRHSTKTDKNSLKTGSLLYQEKNLEHPLGTQITPDQDSHLRGPLSTDHYVGNYQTFLPPKSNLYTADNSSFSPVHQPKAEEDESVVSSTTNEKKPERLVLLFYFLVLTLRHSDSISFFVVEFIKSLSGYLIVALHVKRAALLNILNPQFTLKLVAC